MIFTKSMLWSLLAAPEPRTVTIKGVTGIVSAVEREDGSGRSFNVTMNTKKGKVTVHVRTVD